MVKYKPPFCFCFINFCLFINDKFCLKILNWFSEYFPSIEQNFRINSSQVENNFYVVIVNFSLFPPLPISDRNKWEESKLKRKKKNNIKIRWKKNKTNTLIVLPLHSHLRIYEMEISMAIIRCVECSLTPYFEGRKKINNIYTYICTFTSLSWSKGKEENEMKIRKEKNI